MNRFKKWTGIFFACLVAVLAAGRESAVDNSSSPPKNNVMLVAPARPTVLQLAIDLAKMRNITVVSFRGKVAERPLLHVWTKGEWQYISFDDFCSFQFAGRMPGTIIVIGDDQTVPKALLQGISLAGKKSAGGGQIERLSTMNIAELINGMNPYFKFSSREWRQLAASYDLKLSGAKAPSSGQAAGTNVARQTSSDTSSVAPLAKTTAGLSGKQKPVITGPGTTNEFWLYLNEDEYISFVWIAPLSLWVGQYEITNDQYKQFNRAHDPKRYYDHILDMPDQAVVLVSWEKANNYCGWLNRNFSDQLPSGFKCRLPTEKEWMVFAACGREVTYPWGNQWPPPDSFNYKGMEGASMFYSLFHQEKFIEGHNDGFIVAAPVRKSGMNEWGLYGVGGNVWEWCQDWFDDTRMLRVVKGGAWNNYEPEIMAISNRSGVLPEKSNAMIGFRIVIAPPPKM